MGKRARQTNRELRHLEPARQLLRAADQVAKLTHHPGTGTGAGLSRTQHNNLHGGRVAANMLAEWGDTRVVLTPDQDLLDALLATDTDVTVDADWLDRIPFPTVAVALPEPVVTTDNQGTARYHGFIATGITAQAAPPDTRGGPIPADPSTGTRPVWTVYGPIPDSDGVRILWTFDWVDGPPGVQTITHYHRNRRSDVQIPVDAGRRLADIIADKNAMYRLVPGSDGNDADLLVPLAYTLLLYISSQEPDLEDEPPARTSAARGRLQGARVVRTGWRVGAELRTLHHTAHRGGTDGDDTSPDGKVLRRRPAPHLRQAHFHRVRVAERDEDGRIVGSTSGTQGADWHYERRWYPPTPVALDRDDKLPPTVRPLR